MFTGVLAVVLVFEAVFGVRWRSRSCLLAIDTAERQVVPTALGGAFTPFSQRSRSWVALTDLGDAAIAPC